MRITVLAVVMAAVCAHTSANAESLESLKQQLEEQQSQIEVLADALEQKSSFGGAWFNKTTMGGYGEVHLNRLDDQNGDSDKEELDLHRFVLFLGYQYNKDVRFVSEIEVEHNVAGEGKNGEVEIEQAFIDWSYVSGHTLNAGVFLMPVGILNETHEPDTFYGVERNNVEKNIIPTTWWEGGLAFKGQLIEGMNYDVALTSGLALDAGKFKVRDGRKKTSEAPASDFAYTAGINYTVMPGVSLGATLQLQSDLTQGEGDDKISATLMEIHAVVAKGDFGFRALYASWDIDEEIDTWGGTVGADSQEGFYIEPSYKISEKLGVFARLSTWDNQAGDSADTEYQQTDIGLNYWLADKVVFKFDYQTQDVPEGKAELQGVNLGVGWSF